MTKAETHEQLLATLSPTQLEHYNNKTLPEARAAGRTYIQLIGCLITVLQGNNCVFMMHHSRMLPHVTSMLDRIFAEVPELPIRWLGRSRILINDDKVLEITWPGHALAERSRSLRATVVLDHDAQLSDEQRAKIKDLLSD